MSSTSHLPRNWQAVRLAFWIFLIINHLLTITMVTAWQEIGQKGSTRNHKNKILVHQSERVSQSTPPPYLLLWWGRSRWHRQHDFGRWTECLQTWDRWQGDGCRSMLPGHPLFSLADAKTTKTKVGMQRKAFSRNQGHRWDQRKKPEMSQLTMSVGILWPKGNYNLLKGTKDLKITSKGVKE